MAARPLLAALAAALALAGCSETAVPVSITGSATVLPFTKVVADRFVQAQEGRAAPAIDSVGTGPGFRRFCAGAESATPDIVAASRRMRRAEYDACRNNGVADVIELRIGLDGIVLAESTAGPKLSLTRKDIFLALAAAPGGRPNAARTWRDVNPALPALPIKVIGPAATSGTRDLFADLILEPGCLEAEPTARALQTGSDPAAFARLCRETRTDGPYVTGGEDYTATAQAVERDPQALGLVGYSYLERQGDKLRGVAIDGIEPTSEPIASGKYPAARTLFLYVKRAHLKDKPELQAFLDLYGTLLDPGGPLAERGLIPMSAGARDRTRETIRNGEVLNPESLF